MNQPRLDRQVPILGAAITLLVLCALFFAVKPSLAKAEWNHTQFYDGATIGGIHSSNPVCLYPGYAPRLYALYAVGEQHSICVEDGVNRTATRMCTSGPGQPVYDGKPWGEAGRPEISANPPTEGNTTVHGTFWWLPEESGGGGGESPPPPEWHSDNQGGNITEAPDVASWGANRLDVFGRKADGSLAHKIWNGTGWGEWETVGAPGTFASGVGASGSVGKEINVVGRSSSNAAVDEWWNGSSWQLFNFGGNIVGTPDFGSPIGGQRPMSGQGGQKTPSNTGGGPGPLGPRENTGVSIASSPGATSWGSTRTDVVTRAPNGSVQDTWWDGSQTQTTNIGGTIEGSPTIASWAPGRLDVFVRGMDNALWANWYEGGEWHTWHSLGGNLASDPGVASWGPGRLDVVARLADGTVQHWWWQQ